MNKELEEAVNRLKKLLKERDEKLQILERNRLKIEIFQELLEEKEK